MKIRATLLIASLLALSLSAGCRRSEPEPTQGQGVDAAAPSAEVESEPELEEAIEDAGPRPPLQVLRFAFTSEIKAKEPTDKLTYATAGERVYAHMTLRNRAPNQRDEKRSVKVVFRVNEERRTTLDLKVDPSWSYRTWAFNTLKDDDKGELTLQVTDDEGNLIIDEQLPIKPPAKGKAKPAPTTTNKGRATR